MGLLYRDSRYVRQDSLLTSFEAKSGVSGVIYAIIPGCCCITTYAPPLDAVGNSVRGVEFFKKLVDTFVFHNFDSILSHGDKKTDRHNPMNNQKAADRYGKIGALYASAEGDLTELKRILLSSLGVPATIADYDGRTLLHLAASEGHEKIVRYLLRHHVVDVHAVDRWGGTAENDAEKHGFSKIAKILAAHE